MKDRVKRQRDLITLVLLGFTFAAYGFPPFVLLGWSHGDLSPLWLVVDILGHAGGVYVLWFTWMHPQPELGERTHWFWARFNG